MMAQNRMTQQALLDDLDAADPDLLRRVVEPAMHRLIDAEAAAHIGARHGRGPREARPPRWVLPVRPDLRYLCHTRAVPRLYSARDSYPSVAFH
jgi:hypothetical protein